MTQLEIVKDQLLNTGKVSRNWLLRNRITRGASRISDLKRLGLDIVGSSVHTDGGIDYVYTLKSMENKMTDDEIRAWRPTIGNSKHLEAITYRNKYLAAEVETTKEFWRKEFLKAI